MKNNMSLEITLDNEFDVILYSSKCFRCKNILNTNHGFPSNCSIYPKDIPLDIWQVEYTENEKDKHSKCGSFVLKIK